MNDFSVFHQIPTLGGRLLEVIGTALDESAIRFTTCVDVGSAMGLFDFLSLELN